jgi:hypothetical protein
MSNISSGVILLSPLLLLLLLVSLFFSAFDASLSFSLNRNTGRDESL